MFILRWTRAAVDIQRLPLAPFVYLTHPLDKRELAKLAISSGPRFPHPNQDPVEPNALPF